MRFVLRIFCLLFLLPGAMAFQITEVYPDTFLDGDEDEYLVLTGSGSLNGVEITDGEGTIRFPPDARCQEQVIIARNAEKYQKVTGNYPDYELTGSNPAVPEPILHKKVQLANRKDELVLTDNGRIIQNITWPGSFSPRKGQIHLLGPDGKWDERVIMAGSSRFEPATYAHVPGTVFVSPDCGRAVFEDVIRSATRKILVNIYEFTDPGLTDLLCAAADRGVKVHVLIEGGPVGGITPEEQSVIARLTSHGIPVTAMTGVGEDHAPYRYDHAKYLVIDDEQVLLTTENFKEHSFPPAGMAGNRGWGVILRSPELAAYFSRVFSEDSDGPGVVPVTGYSTIIPPYQGDRYTPVFSPVHFTARSVTPVLSPDTSSLIIPLIQSAEKRLLIAEAYIKHWSDGKKNPYLEAAIDAARRGVQVRILLDSYSYNTEGENDNDEIVAEVTSIADHEQIPLQARLIDLSGSGLLKLHAKGVVADDTVFISSINWNENSPVFNREAGVIIEDATAAGYFASVFEKDWQGSPTPAGTGAAGPDTSRILTAALVILCLGALWWFRHHRR